MRGIDPRTNHYYDDTKRYIDGNQKITQAQKEAIFAGNARRVFTPVPSLLRFTMSKISTQVAIIGAGLAGLMLGRLLDQAGIANVIIERQSQDYVLARIRAGILEQTTVDLLDQAGASNRLHKEGIVHHGVQIAYDKQLSTIGLGSNTGGKVVTAYGQTEVTADLCALRATSDHPTYYSAADVAIHDFDTSTPSVTFTYDGKPMHITCAIIAGCDGYHGVCRASVPASSIQTYEKIYPFGWLGLLSDTPPVATEVVYGNDKEAFALCSMRSMTRSRYYIQCGLDDKVEDWSDDAFWDELRRRLPDELAQAMSQGHLLKIHCAFTQFCG